MEQLMAFGVVPSDPNLASKAFTDLRSELAKEKAAWKKAQTIVETLARAIEDLKISPDMLATQISTLEEKVKHLDNKVLDGVTELQARDLYLEWTTKANDDYMSQNVRLTKKLESKLLLSPKHWLMLDLLPLLTPLWLAESNVELNAMKVMVENVVTFFYPGDSSIATQAPQMLDGLLTQSWEIILANMKQSTSLTVRILKFLYPHVDLDAAG
jgi:hypothetical protein